MHKGVQRIFGRLTALLGLLLAASLAYGAVCQAGVGGKMAGASALADPCFTSMAGRAACVVASQGADINGAVLASGSPEPTQPAGAAQRAPGTLRALYLQQPRAGLSPASPVPIHILLRRYLS